MICACRIGSLVLLGTHTGLWAMDLKLGPKAMALGDFKKVTQIEYLASAQCAFVMATKKTSQIRLFNVAPNGGLKTRDDGIKIPESKVVGDER